jgi:hypothetical protein
VTYFQIESNSWSECTAAGVGQPDPWPWSADQWKLKSILKWGFNRQFWITWLSVTVTTAAAARATTKTVHFHGELTD